ncbi:MAG: NUDIX hydrolase [Parcubacteria group bacterium GW2011_GWA2_43_9b]|uniref:Nudix hydrolase domain-containing protein n=1 Tax=Candidatus Portnoybacteria bacterium RIFCSPLOWO2_02_FULL_39_11 TaxID=1802001 RepID=A0A1G2FU30_9BACT|nr:MAG: NUDIX hydrolase [Parcubacteria group bacterium GW2011_GWA2_43_9b]OGZ41120.1 MAG: hypothetical protein A3B04_01350 [Candidatus Portnoybacteria bacterium RIFCSPLOWO2_02_FULL_39_11]
MEIPNWTKIKEDLIKDGFRKVIKRTFQLGSGEVFDFEIKQEDTAACVLALTGDNKVILVKQFRPGPEKVLLELPGGAIDNNEKPEEAIRRELLEEAGYNGDFQFVSQSLHYAYSTLIKFNFIALNCNKVQEPKTDKNEFTEVILMPLNEFKNHLRGGQLTDVETGYLGLDFLKLL